MKSLIELQIAVLGDDTPAIQDYLSEIDRKTENTLFKQAADAFGFKTLEHHGRRLAMRADLANVMGYKDESGLRKLCERYDFEGIKTATFGQNVRMLAVKEFGLHANDGKTIFVGWEVFLIAGMKGTSDNAHKVQQYLLQAERAARIASGALDMAKVRKNQLDETGKVIQMLSKADRIQNAKFKAYAYEKLDALLEGALSNVSTAQGDLFDKSTHHNEPH